MKDAMTCEGFEGMLPRYLEGETDAAERVAVESHAARCAGCGPLLRGIDEITREASALPMLAPSRDLWEGIASRIEAPAIAIGSRRAVPSSVEGARPHAWRTGRLAAAAAALMIVTAGITHVATRQMLATDSGPVAVYDIEPEPVTFGPAVVDGSGDPAILDGSAAPALAGEPGEATPDAGPVVAAAPRSAAPRQAPVDAGPAAGSYASRAASIEAVYDVEISALQDVLDRRRAELDPATTVVLENNLRIIDRAIRDSRSALARDPASGFLNDQLTMALDKKLQLMRTAAKLPTRT